MPTSIIDIDVKSEKFQEFYALWSKYQEQLGKTPSKWDAINDYVKQAAEAEATVTEEIKDQNAALDKQARTRKEGDRTDRDAEKHKADERKRVAAAERETARVTREREKSTARALENTKRTVASVASGAVALAKWAALGGLTGVVAGAAGLWGLGNFAGSVGDARRAAAGLGTSTGRQQAFGLNFGRLVDPAQLGRVADAQSSIGKRWIFSALGIGNPQGQDPAELAATAAPRARRLFMQGGQTEEYANAVGLTQIYTIEELRRFANTSEKEMSSVAAAYRKDAAALNISDDVNRKWQDLSVQLGRAGLGIKKTFVEGLEPLVPQLERFSGSFAQAIGTLLKAAEDQGWVDQAAAGIEKLATYMASPEFTADVKGFIGNVGLVGDGILNLLRVLHLVPQDPATVTPGGGAAGAGGTFGNMGGLSVTNDKTGKTQDYSITPYGVFPIGGAKFVKPYTAAQVQGVADLTNGSSRYDDMFKAAGEKYGVPWRELKARAAMESGLNPVVTGPMTKYGQAIGLMQVNAQAHGLNPDLMRDPSSNIDAGAKIYADALRKAKGDRHLADAIYYGSPGKPESEQYAANGDAVRKFMGIGGTQQAATGAPANDNADVLAALRRLSASGVTSLSGLVRGYENTSDRAALSAEIQRIAGATGIGANDAVGGDASLRAVAAAIRSAKAAAPTTVAINVNNATGGNATTSVAQSAR